MSNASSEAKRLSEYLESSDVGIVRVTEEEDEPISATGAGSVASVPQSPFNSNRMKRWIGKRTGSRPSSPPPGEVVHTKKGPQKAKDSLVRSLVDPNSGNNIDNHYGEFSPANSRSIEPLSMGSYEGNETPPAAALYEMVTLKTSIPDRPRESDLMEDDLEYFDDVGDVAIGDDEEAFADEGEDEHEEEEEYVDDYSNANGRERPQLKEHMISSIKSYHGPQEDYDDDDGEFTDDESLLLHTDVPQRSKSIRSAANAPSESDVTHSFEKPNNLQVTDPIGRRAAVLS